MCNYMYIYLHMAVTENEGCPHNRNFMDKKMINHVVFGVPNFETRPYHIPITMFL